MGCLLAAVAAVAQEPAATPATPPPSAAQGGAIHGAVVAGTPGKPGGIALPGVAVTATNSLTGKKFTTTTDINGAYAMQVPRNGRYVVRVEFAAFAAQTAEVLVNAASENGGKPDQTADFGMQLASRVAAAEAREAAATTAANRGVQSLSLSSGSDADTSDATAGAQAANQGAALPSLAGLGDSAGAATDSVAVSGAVGQTNGLAGFSEDQIRDRIDDAMAQARASGQLPPGADISAGAVVSMIGGMMGGGPGGGGGRGGGARGGRAGGGGGGGGGGGFSFRNFNPAQPHGAIFYQGGNSALNSSQWLVTSPNLPHFKPNPSAYSNRFGLTLAASPYIPGLTKPNSSQFAFLNITGQRNLNPFTASGRVPTLLERAGNFSQSTQLVNGLATPVNVYDPASPAKPQFSFNGVNNVIDPARIAAAAKALLTYYPAPNIATTDPTAYNYQTISNAGSNNIAINSRYVRTLGNSPNGLLGAFGGGAARRAAGGTGRNTTGPQPIRQNINVSFNYSHAATDNRNIFLPLGGGNVNNGYGLNVGYTISRGRLSNNASVNWNRNSSQTRNYFTDTALNPSTAAGINIPNQASNFADPRFYNGLPQLQITNFTALTNTTPSQSLAQTVAFSDFVSWRHGKHNMRFGADVRRVHNDTIGGSQPLGSFSFTGYATQNAADQNATATGSTRQASTGSGFADFLLGQPTQTSLQAGLNKIYLRQNVLDAYAQDDFRVLANVTLNFGLRWEYFAPLVEKNNRLVNLDHSADFTSVVPVMPGGTGTFLGAYPRSLVNPDRTMFAPRIGVAWRPKSKSIFTKETVVRFGYGINYNTDQYRRFATLLSFQPPYANTQTNALSTAANPSGCNFATMTLSNGFGCSGKPIQNNFAVNKDYRLGMVQVYNLNIQRTLPHGTVMNLGYNGAKGSDLDVVRAPNHTATAVTTTTAQAFRYEDSLAASHLNQLIVSVQKRQQKGIALGATYVYSHSIDDATSIGGSIGPTAQNDKRLDLEEANSSFDQRHRLSGNWVLELPFGPNRAYLNQGGFWSKALDNFSLSGEYTFASGTYFTPSYANSAAQELAGGNYTLRPDRVFSQPIGGSGTLLNYFNKAAFASPAASDGFGTASRNSIRGPGTVSINTSLARTVPLGDTRSFEARVTATNVFNTVQYNGINTVENSANFGQVTGAAPMRALQVQARYRF